MIEKIIFNILAFALFTLVFLRLVRKNDTSYVYLLVLQFIGIAINFFELIIGKSFGAVIKIVMYLISIIIPLIVAWIEYKMKIELFDILYLGVSKFFYKIGNYEISKKYLEHILDKNPNNDKAYELLANIYEKLGKYELALEEYEKAYEINEKNFKLLLKVGELNNKIGMKERAVNTLSNLLKRKPEYYEASILLGDIYYNNGCYKEATMTYMSALKYRPNNYELNYYIGMSFTMLNDFNRAKEYYDKAAIINSNLYHARFSIGQIELIAGELDNAEVEFMKCIDVEELEAEAYYYLARISMIKGEIEKAKNYANIAIEEKSEIFYRMAEENIFSPIIDKINKSQNIKNISKNKALTEREKQVDNHLHETANLVGKLNNDDIAVIKNMKKQKEEHSTEKILESNERTQL